MCISKSVYLCGSMSNLKGFGLGWRTKINKWLDNQGILCYNPCTKEMDDHVKNGVRHDEKHKWEKLPQSLQEEILCKDMDQVANKSSFIICYFTRYSTGTVSELSLALFSKVPVYFVTTRKLVGWVATVANAQGNKVFRTFKQLQKFLKVKQILDIEKDKVESMRERMMAERDKEYAGRIDAYYHQRRKYVK